MTPEEHEKEIEEAFATAAAGEDEQRYSITRKTELEYASAVLMKISELAEQVRTLNDDLAELLAEDAGLDFAKGKDTALFLYDQATGELILQIKKGA